MAVRATRALSASLDIMAALVSGMSIREATTMTARYPTTSRRCPPTNDRPAAMTAAKAELAMMLKAWPGRPLMRSPARVASDSASRAARAGSQPVRVAPVARRTGCRRANSTRRPAARAEAPSSSSLARAVAADMRRHTR